jgi:hypothetical protein
MGSIDSDKTRHPAFDDPAHRQNGSQFEQLLAFTSDFFSKTLFFLFGRFWTGVRPTPHHLIAHCGSDISV